MYTCASFRVHACVVAVCMHIIFMYVYTCIRIYAGVHVCLCVYIVKCIRVRGYVCVSSCIWLRFIVFRIRLVRSEPSYRRPGADPDSCSLWTQYNGDSKIVPWDDS